MIEIIQLESTRQMATIDYFLPRNKSAKQNSDQVFEYQQLFSVLIKQLCKLAGEYINLFIVNNITSIPCLLLLF